MKFVKTIIIFSFLFIHSSAQSNLSVLLKEVEKNNQKLIAANNLREAAKLETRTNINPGNPFVNYGHYPGSNTEMGTKTTFSVNQQFQFPTIYSTKRKIADKQQDYLDISYSKVRKDILLKAKLLFYEYVFLTKKEKAFSYRLDNALQLYESYQTKVSSGNASILDANRAKILYISVKGKHLLIKQERYNTEKELTLLNGGKKLPPLEIDYEITNMHSLDSIKNELIVYSPELSGARKAVEASELETSLSKQNWLPDFQVGYESETEPDGSYSGINAGVSIPIWRDKNKVKLAQAKHLYNQAVSSATEKELFIKVEKYYNEAKEFEIILKEFEETLTGSTDLQFLAQAYNAGQISIIEYIMELKVFYNLTDLFLETEKGYYKALAELYAYRL